MAEYILNSPTLPTELEREIFELTALSRPVSIPKLMRISWRVKDWVEPFLYRTLVVCDKNSRNKIIEFPSCDVESFTLQTKSECTSVRNLMLDLTSQDSPSEAQIPTILSASPGVENLYITVNNLSLVEPFSSNHISALRHLHCNIEILRVQRLLVICPYLLEACKTLRALVILRLQTTLSAPSVPVPEILTEDPRFVVLHLGPCPKYDWQQGVLIGLNYWARVDAFITKRRIGKIPLRTFLLDESSLFEEITASAATAAGVEALLRVEQEDLVSAALSINVDLIVDVDADADADGDTAADGDVQEGGGATTDTYQVANQTPNKFTRVRRAAAFILFPSEPDIEEEGLTHIGINGLSFSNEEYRFLHGPRHDVVQMKALLIESYGYSDQNIRMLVDDEGPGHMQPDRESILASIESFANNTHPGDKLFFQCLVPLDGEDRMITNNELRTRLVDRLPTGATLVAVFDSCHSASLLDLEHLRCNRVFVPWLSKGKRKSDGMRNVLGIETSGPSGGVPLCPAVMHHLPVIAHLTDQYAFAAHLNRYHVQSRAFSSTESPQSIKFAGIQSYTLEFAR
ncbi:hypothetical protein C8R43DRAFT_1125381 [Mycena crocata]|nr:hypothetical protein C8R43DRAFT_1125381 [Mycena crocata]